MSFPIKSGDMVLVLSGKDKGKKGKVLQVLPSEWKVVVEGVNQMTKNVRARRQNEQGQIVKFNGPLHVSNVMRVDDVPKPTRGKTKPAQPESTKAPKPEAKKSSV